MLKLIKEIEFLIENKQYYSAFALTLMLPDICIHSKNLDGRKEYIKWVNDNIFYENQYFCFTKFDNDTIIALGTQKDEYDYESKHLLPNESLEKVDSINGEVLYALRCSFLHAGNIIINVGKKPINIEVSLITNDYDVEFSCRIGMTNKKQAYMIININSLCKLICKKVEEYYYKHSKDFENLLKIDNVKEDEMLFYISDKYIT